MKKGEKNEKHHDVRRKNKKGMDRYREETSGERALDGDSGRSAEEKSSVIYQMPVYRAMQIPRRWKLNRNSKTYFRR